jgi:MarR family transcriptional regulator, organic hydroperoxide resistance regulator
VVVVDPIRCVKTSHSLALREVFTDLSYDAGVTEHPRNDAAPLAYQLAEAAYALHAALERHLHDALVELDLTIALSDAIWQLDPKLGPLSRRELAERLHCDPSNVTFLVDRLESRRLLTRARARSDRRTQALALTPAGIEVRDRLFRTIADSSMFTTLTRAQQRQLVDLLQRCIDPGQSSR